MFVLEYKGNRLNLYSTDLDLDRGDVLETWRVRWEIEEFHRDVKAPGLQDSFLSSRLQGYLLLFVTVVNAVRYLVASLNLRSVEDLLRFVEIRLGGALGLMKTFKLR
ncbi:hypothetical protein IC006_0417 [Sulfuracidifex tepidarius]|uniref:Uncharacterized protein n=1 Tax=Sulfuracidifex tepidarius TaxID=1294262 RepID=A0A510DSH9_9CREN|nr:hypothetical protein IC006_0417 [Sulfuracidifex tepidarius]